jgi:hypothetical protein
MSDLQREFCPNCRKPMLLLLRQNRGLPPVLRCLDCDDIDPLKSVQIRGWAKSRSLKPPRKPR